MQPAFHPQARRVGALAALCLGLAYLPGVVQAAEARAEPSQRAPTPPLIQARGAVLIDARTGGLLYGRDEHRRLPPASLTKIATAIVALERAEPTRTILATVNSQVEPSVIGMEPGDRLPLAEALYGLLLNSGNDAALAIAETLGEGSIVRFVEWMNQLALALGLENSHFANPHGLDSGDHYSSAHDLAILSRVLLRWPLLRAVVQETRRDYQGPPLWAFRNTNAFLRGYPGADGVKTGFETRAGRCLAASATRDGRQLIAVVLNSPRFVEDAAALMDYGFALLRYRERELASSPRGGTLDPVLAQAGALPSSGYERAFVRGWLRSDGLNAAASEGDARTSGSAFTRLQGAANLARAR